MQMTHEMSVAVQYQSHLPALLACIVATEGPVLELGVGFFSTPHLHALCGALGRTLVSIEPDLEWLREFSRYETVTHDFGSQLGNIERLHWGVSFIDHSPGGANRAEAFRRLIEISAFVVMHDAQREAENFQAVEPMLKGLNWHLCVNYWPHTLVASKSRKIPEVLKGM